MTELQDVAEEHAARVSTRKTRCWLCGGSGLAEIGAGDA